MIQPDVAKRFLNKEIQVMTYKRAFYGLITEVTKTTLTVAGHVVALSSIV